MLVTMGGAVRYSKFHEKKASANQHATADGQANGSALSPEALPSLKSESATPTEERLKKIVEENSSEFSLGRRWAHAWWPQLAIGWISTFILCLLLIAYAAAMHDLQFLLTALSNTAAQKFKQNGSTEVAIWQIASSLKLIDFAMVYVGVVMLCLAAALIVELSGTVLRRRGDQDDVTSPNTSIGKRRHLGGMQDGSIKLSAASAARAHAALIAIVPAVPLSLIVIAIYWLWYRLRPASLESMPLVLGDAAEVYTRWWSKFLNSPMLAGTVMRKLNALVARGGSSEPFLVIRGYQSVPYRPFRRPPDPADNDWSFGHFMRAKTAGVLLDLLGCVMRAKRTDPHANELFRDYVSNFRSQKDHFTDGDDLPLRFRQSSPELHFHSPDRKSDNAHVFVPRFTVYSCLRNPIEDPIWVLPVASVLRYLSEAIAKVDGLDRRNDEEAMLAEKRAMECLRELKKPQFIKYDKFIISNSDGVHMVRRNRSQPVAIMQGGDFSDLSSVQMAWDSHKIFVADHEPGPASNSYLAPISYLITAIQLASSEAREVHLAKGDVLVIDNLRALVCRKEYDFRHLKRSISPFAVNLALLGWPQRWLRLYYGFPR